MTVINTTLLNFNYANKFHSVLDCHGNEFEYTENRVIRRINPPSCPTCNTKMNHNGYNPCRKNGLGSTNVGKYICPSCGKNCEEDRTHWTNMKNQIYNNVAEICQALRICQVSYRRIPWIFQKIFPITINKDNVYELVNNSVEDATIPSIKEKKFVYYDEQYTSVDGNDKYRLTLLDDDTSRPIADKIRNRMDGNTIKEFIETHLNPNKPIFIVTDHLPTYPDVLKNIFGDNLTHQLCLTHLSSLIVKDFPRNSTFKQESVKYQLLNIFYNRSAELKYLGRMVEKERRIEQKGKKVYKAWLKKEKAAFNSFVHELELKRRRKKMNLEPRPYRQALRNFNVLMREKESFDISVQKRLKLIDKRWKNLTAFYFVDGAPATNNKLENYYSRTLKKYHKKKFRTDGGIQRHLKLHEMEGAGMLDGRKNTLFDQLQMFLPFLNPG